MDYERLIPEQINAPVVEQQQQHTGCELGRLVIMNEFIVTEWIINCKTCTYPSSSYISIIMWVWIMVCLQSLHVACGTVCVAVQHAIILFDLYFSNFFSNINFYFCKSDI